MADVESITLTNNREVLIRTFLKKRDPGFLEAFTGILDDYFQTEFGKSAAARQMTAAKNPVALIALGGYGRQEQCIHSDVDLLILFKKKVPKEAGELVKELMYPLWDAHLETGYAVRSIPECLAMAWEHFDILTTILDARFICGSSPIYCVLMEKFRKGISKRHRQKSLRRLMENGKKLREDFGDSTYLLEPNLKSGHGGLRDYHTILWCARILSEIKNRKDLEAYGFLSHEEYETMEDALNFIWRIRNMLHHITGRKCDQLHFEHQMEMAKLLGFKEKQGHKAVESFMGELHAKMEFIKQINLALTENIQLNKRGNSRFNRAKPTRVEGIEIQDRMLFFSLVEQLPEKPDLLLKIFVESGRKKIPLSIEARRIVSDFNHLVDAKFRNNSDNVKAFEKILSLSFWEFNVLNVMHSTGLLERFIPEFKKIRNKIQFNQYHLYPVDKHSIRCVQVVNDFINQSFYSDVYKEIRLRKILLLSALFHDIGKADPKEEHSNRGADMTRFILERSGYSPPEVDEVEFLVRNHLFLVKTATRRDTSDEETILFCAGKIKKVSRLRLLYLLSVADSMATGPKAWSEWTESLLRNLFLKTLNVLKKGGLASKSALKAIQYKKEAVVHRKKREWNEKEFEKEIDLMSRRYLFYVSPEEIIDHVGLYKKLEDKNFIWTISGKGESDIRTVSICGRDKPGFLSKLSGVFFMNNLNIVGSQVFSWGGGIAMDIFKVTPPRDRIFESDKWEKAKNDLDQAITDDGFLDRLKERIPKKLTPSSGQIPKPNSVRIDNRASSFFTIIEVFSYDFPGLLFAITDTLYRKGLDVRAALVATKVDQVVDVFYVKNLEDEKIESAEQVDDIKEAIINSLPEIQLQQEAIEV